MGIYEDRITEDSTDFEKWFITSENPIETILKMKDGYEVEEK